MTDAWKSPKYAPNSDIEADNQEESESSDFEASPKGEVKGTADPWNDPEDDDDDDDDDDTFLRNNASPDYLNSNRANDNGQPKGNGAWDALHSDDEDEDEDDIPAGLTVGGRETKDSSRNQSTGPYSTSNGGTADLGRSEHEDAEGPQRKKQRTSNDDGSGLEQRGLPSNGTTNQSSELESHRAAPLPPKPTYTVPGSQAPPQRGNIPSNQSVGRVHPSRHAPPPHHPAPGLVMPSFFGITPRDEFVRIIGEWLLRVCHGLQGVEVSGIDRCLSGREADTHSYDDRLSLNLGRWWIATRKNVYRYPACRKPVSHPRSCSIHNLLTLCFIRAVLPENYDCLFLSEMTEVTAN